SPPRPGRRLTRPAPVASRRIGRRSRSTPSGCGGGRTQRCSPRPLSARRRAKGTVGGVLLPWDAIVSQGARTGLSVGSSRAATPWSPVFVQVRTCYPTYPTRCQHEGDGKRAGQSTKSLKSPIAPCHCIHVGDLGDISPYTYIHLFPY